MYFIWLKFRCQAIYFVFLEEKSIKNHYVSEIYVLLSDYLYVGLSGERYLFPYFMLNVQICFSADYLKRVLEQEKYFVQCKGTVAFR